MLGTAIMWAVFIVIVVGLVLATSKQTSEDEAMQAVLTDTPAFEEQIKVPPDPDQLGRLRPLIGQLGLTRAPAGPEKGAAPDAYTIWVCDSLGAMHDVWQGYSEAEAAKIARQFARRLKMPVSDPEHILDGLPVV